MSNTLIKFLIIGGWCFRNLHQLWIPGVYVLGVECRSCEPSGSDYDWYDFLTLPLLLIMFLKIEK